MSELLRMWPTIALGLLGGFALAAIFFGGLWLTVTRMTSGRGGPLLFPLSLLVRLVILGGGLFLAAQFGAAALLSCSVGIVAARAVALRWVRVPSGHQSTAEEVSRS